MERIGQVFDAVGAASDRAVLMLCGLLIAPFLGIMLFQRLGGTPLVIGGFLSGVVGAMPIALSVGDFGNSVLWVGIGAIYGVAVGVGIAARSGPG